MSSDEEIKFLSYLQKSQMKEEERLSANDDSDDNFYRHAWVLVLVLVLVLLVVATV